MITSSHVLCHQAWLHHRMCCVIRCDYVITCVVSSGVITSSHVLCHQAWLHHHMCCVIRHVYIITCVVSSDVIMSSRVIRHGDVTRRASCSWMSLVTVFEKIMQCIVSNITISLSKRFKTMVVVFLAERLKAVVVVQQPSSLPPTQLVSHHHAQPLRGTKNDNKYA